MVKEISKESSNCKAYQSKPGEYEIHEGKSQIPLSLNSKICSCGYWQISGVPCRHAIRAMNHAKLDPHQFVSSWYSVKTYKKIYSFLINPIPDREQWPIQENMPLILPPKMKRGVGRPSRNRRREEGEEKKGKRAKTVKCKKCGYFGHNFRTCKGGLTEKELRAVSTPVVIRNPRIRDQSNAAKKAKAAAKNSELEASKSVAPKAKSVPPKPKSVANKPKTTPKARVAVKPKTSPKAKVAVKPKVAPKAKVQSSQRQHLKQSQQHCKQHQQQSQQRKQSLHSRHKHLKVNLKTEHVYEL